MTGILCALAGVGGEAGAIRYSSRSANVSEGATSNFPTASGMAGGWGYGGNNTDAITITTTGATAKLQGWTIGNTTAGPNSFTFRLAIISGSATNGTILKQETITARALSTGAGQTMILFSDGGLSLAPGTYTICFIWDTSQPGENTFYMNGGNRSPSSITGSSGSTLNVAYGTATFNGSGALGSSNGTTGNSSGQNITLQWFF